MDAKTLIVLPPIRGVPRPNRKMILSQKFFDGMSLYRELWKGPLILVCETASQTGDNMDNIEIDLDRAPFETICEQWPFDQLFDSLLNSETLVLASAGEKFNQASERCRRKRAACVYITEYSLRTRLEIIRVEQKTPIHGLWRSWKQIKQEQRQVRAISLANGVQCNGTPTFIAYEHLTPKPLLFFDTRLSETMLPTPTEVATRLDRFKDRHILRLAFSGRLVPMKGADHLPLVADHLRRIGIEFEMTIFGDGVLKQSMQNAVAGLGLENSVKFRFAPTYEELNRLMKSDIDLFVCCHRQGDPSTTYVETMACGVPIVGYSNEAFEGLVKISSVGWITPQGKPRDLAERIASIYRNPAALREASLRSLEFARELTFRKVFKARIDHLNSIMEDAAPGPYPLRSTASQADAVNLNPIGHRHP